MSQKPGPSQRETADHWGTSQPYVAKLKKAAAQAGAPFTTLAEQDNFRATYNQRGAGYRSRPKVSPEPTAAAGPPPKVMPPPAPVVAPTPPPALAAPAGPAPLPGPAPYKRPDPPPPEPKGLPAHMPPEPVVRELTVPDDRGRLESLSLSLQASIDVETEAHACVLEAQKDGSALGAARLAPLMATYNAAKTGRLASEKAVRALQLQEEVLVPLETAKSLVSRFWGPHLVQLRALSKRASKANPGDRPLAEEIISIEVEAVITATEKLYRKFMETGKIEESEANA